VRVVIDTNVLVSGLMKKGTPPASVVRGLYSGELVALYDQRILSEYRDVLVRPKLARIHLPDAMDLLDFIDARGEELEGASFAHQLPDPGDQPFAEVAFTGKAELLITGNVRDFPVGDLIRVVTPRQWLDLKATFSGD
jgi:uncharacterized protein